MKKRSVIAVVLLPIVTFGIYALYWFVKTKGELNAKGAQIPTAWLLIVPIVNIYWVWKYYEGAEHATNSKVNGLLMFVLNLFITAIIPMAICQDAYNNLAETSTVTTDMNTAPSLDPVITPSTAPLATDTAQTTTPETVEPPKIPTV